MQGKKFTVICPDGLSAHIHRIISIAEPPTHKNLELAVDIATILYGSKKIRLSNEPSPTEHQAMISRISRFIKIGAPIEILSLWGATKGYGQDNNRLGIDLADALGIRRFACLDHQIRTIYTPGLKVRIIREDVGEWVLCTSTTNLPQKMHTYCSQLDTLAAVIGGVEFTDESTLLTTRSIDTNTFLNQGRNNAESIQQYWTASDTLPEILWDSTPEHQAVRQTGWNGVIPSITRDYYLQRAATEHRQATKNQLITAVCTYLGMALARYQLQLFNGTYTDQQGTIPPLKASFTPYPPGTPNTQRTGRLEYKVKDSKNSNNSTPPWCGYGCMTHKGEASILNLNNYKNYHLEQTEIEVQGENGKCKFRADLARAI